MRFYDNEVQRVKNDVLKLVARYAKEGTLEMNRGLIPLEITPGPKERLRCCIYHERAVTAERVAVAMGEGEHLINILETACDQCPVNRFVVTEACRGCIAQRCVKSCPVGAIHQLGPKVVIDYERCIECGKCQQACPYNAIADVMRPCRRECPTGAIKMDYRKKAVIDYDLCIACGACVYQCPFGAIQDQSSIIPVIEVLRKGEGNVYAMVAPAFSTQFEYVRLTQAVSGIRALGFRDVVEVALGADLVVQHEGDELLAKMEDGQIMTSSCCPGFVSYVEKKFPELRGHVSHTVSPMIATARLIRSIDPNAVLVFIGPCIAKKTEKSQTDDVDYVLTFEELVAMIEAYNIDLTQMTDYPMDNASYYGRRFAASGGLSLALSNHLSKAKTQPRLMTCDGIKECDTALKKLKANRLEIDFIEGMACKGGCVKGPVTMHHGPKDLKAVETYAKLAREVQPIDATCIFDQKTIRLL